MYQKFPNEPPKFKGGEQVTQYMHGEEVFHVMDIFWDAGDEGEWETMPGWMYWLGELCTIDPGINCAKCAEHEKDNPDFKCGGKCWTPEVNIHPIT